MFFRARELAPGEIHVALACFDGPIDRAPAAHVFDESRVGWIVLGDELPRHDRDSPGLAKYQVLPRTPTVPER